jgi:nitroimidazol reductase NimA-like FMN-containing flavoprotein (pyridoxamine 5'-phosphate oxidase superfamily)
MSLRMTQQEREAFLADVHVGVISIHEPDRGPLTVPIWYDYEPGGDLWLITERASRKGRLLEAAQRFSLCTQIEVEPYRYVSVEGPVTSIETSDTEKYSRPMAHRYLGKEVGDGYIKATQATEGENVVVRMRPERWLTVDYAKEFGA